MSHDRGWRAACIVTIWILGFHFEMHEVARGVTAMVVGSGALLGRAEVDELSLHLQDYPIYFNLLRGLVDPFKELHCVTSGRQGGRDFGEGHNYLANVIGQPRRELARRVQPDDVDSVASLRR
jgi:hypothetical protein